MGRLLESESHGWQWISDILLIRITEPRLSADRGLQDQASHKQGHLWEVDATGLRIVPGCRWRGTLPFRRQGAWEGQQSGSREVSLVGHQSVVLRSERTAQRDRASGECGSSGAGRLLWRTGTESLERHALRSTQPLASPCAGRAQRRWRRHGSSLRRRIYCSPLGLLQ